MPGAESPAPLAAQTPRDVGTYCFMARSLESMLSCLPFINCTSVSSLVTLSWRILKSSLFRVDTWVPGRGQSLRRPPPQDTEERAKGLRSEMGLRCGSDGPSGRGLCMAGPGQQEAWGHGAGLLTLVTFLLIFSRSCSWPRRKHGCWNSVSSRSGFTRPPCSMWTTFRKPSARDGGGGWGGRASG